MTMRVAVAVSGRGSNLEALLRALGPGAPARVALVLSDRAGAPALERAREQGVPAEVLPDPSDGGDWLARLERYRIDLVVLAGYLKLVPAAVTARYRDRIVNVHPALLPEFPGLDAVGQALAAGAEVTGVTGHFVDEGVDTGPVILQRAVPVPAGGDRGELERAVHAVEHHLAPEAIRMIAGGRVRIDADDPRVVLIDE
jgi:formyltetrahydrofolate-dependent phosphoribosylglycinamide formyltransferase